MTLKRWDGAVWVDLTTLKRWDGAAWVDLTTAKRWDGAAWVDLAGFGGGSGFSVTVAPAGASGSVTGASPLFKVVTSNSVTATPTGGTGPYTYSWTKVTGSSSISAASPTAATTTFSATVGRGSVVQATWRITVTDSLSATTTADISVELEYVDTSDF